MIHKIMRQLRRDYKIMSNDMAMRKDNKIQHINKI